MAEPESDSQLLINIESSNESNFFEADPVAARESRCLYTEACELKRAERALDEHPYMGGDYGEQSSKSFLAPARMRRPILLQVKSRGASTRRRAAAGVRSLRSRTSTWNASGRKVRSTSTRTCGRQLRRAGLQVSKRVDAFETNTDAGLEDAAARAAAALNHEREGGTAQASRACRRAEHQR